MLGHYIRLDSIVLIVQVRVGVCWSTIFMPANLKVRGVIMGSKKINTRYLDEIFCRDAMKNAIDDGKFF